nr:YraN family protein [Geothrix sp. SG200]
MSATGSSARSRRNCPRTSLACPWIPCSTPWTSPVRRGEAARRLGLRAERLTLWLLWARGWDLVAWRQKLGRYELDLLLSRGPELRLLEVKARRPGAWVGADTALEPEQRLRLQQAFRAWLDRVPWPGQVTFQRVSWAGLRCRFHPPERWDALKLRP